MADTLLLQALALQHNPWQARMFLAASTAVTGISAIPFDTISYDPNSNLTTGAEAKYTCPVDGYYACNVVLALTVGATNQVMVYKNGAVALTGVSAASLTRWSVSGTVKCIAGDTLDARPNASATSLANAGGDATYLDITFVRPA